MSSCLNRFLFFVFGIICLLCSLFAFVPIVGTNIEATVTENSQREVHAKRGGDFLYTKKNNVVKPKMKTEYTYSYEFTVNGEKYTGSSTENELIHKKGGKVTVYYLPFYPKIHTSIQKNHLFILCGICFICGLVLLRSSFTGRRPAINIGGGGNDIYHQDWGPKYPNASAIASVKNQIATPQPVQPQPQQIYQQPVQPQPQQIYQQPQQQIVQQQNSIKPSEYAFCPKCGTPLTGGYAFCPKCGLKLS